MKQYQIITYRKSDNKEISRGQWIEDKNGLQKSWEDECKKIEMRIPEIYHVFKNRILSS